MAGTARFHDKLHRANHHSTPTAGLPDSSYDPIASSDRPFQGDFYLNGSLSAVGSGIFSGLSIGPTILGNDGSTSIGGDSGTTTIGGNNSTTIIGGSASDVTISNSTNIRSSGVSIAGDINITGASSKISVPTVSALSGNFTKLVATSGDFNAITVYTTAKVDQRVGVGITPQYPLHVFGDAFIVGNLSATGTSTFANTNFSTTSAISVINTGTNAAISITQQGDSDIAIFNDDTNIALVIDGHVDKPGWVGVKCRPNVEFTVAGRISASQQIYGSDINASNNITAGNNIYAANDLYLSGVKFENALSGLKDVLLTSLSDGQILQYSESASKWVNITYSGSPGDGGGGGVLVGDSLVSGSITLTAAQVSTFETPLTASGEFLVISINGVDRKIRLWD